MRADDNATRGRGFGAKFTPRVARFDPIRQLETHKASLRITIFRRPEKRERSGKARKVQIQFAGPFSMCDARGILTTLEECMNADAKRLPLIAHRGASHAAPENTLAAFQLAWEEGADGIEGDFQLTRDGEIVCIHDATTRRTASADMPVAGATLAELLMLDFGRWKDAKWVGQRIPTLRELLAGLPPKKRIFIEIKCGVEIIAPLRKLLAESRVPETELTIICFNDAVIREAKRQIPKVKANWLTGYRKDAASGTFTPTPQQVLAKLAACSADGLGTQAEPEVVTQEFVAAVHAAGRECHVWTVNDPVQALRLRDLGVDSLTTDRPAHLRAALEAAS
jgi:glycerophosphoryl diester phosphodiesterase